MNLNSIVLSFLAAATAAVLSYGLIEALRPTLKEYLLARPNARSSHDNATPQGAGIAVVAAVVIVLLVVAILGRMPDGVGMGLIGCLVAVVGLAVVGACDDFNPLPVAPRLALQFLAATLLVWSVPESGRIIGVLPAWIEIPLLVVGLVWFINLTNFMDGLDWLTVAEFVPVTLALALLAALGALPANVGVIAIVLAGALIGFAPHNRHKAQVFLGDVGSLAIGGLVGWMLISLAGAGHIAAALLLALYYLADATVTLWRRYQRGERLSEAHKSHFYQLAHQRGLTVEGVTDRILALNVVLAVLAVVTVLANFWIVSALCLIAGGMLTAGLLKHFEQGGA